MFETAELGRTLSKAEYDATEPVLREALVALQRRVRESDRAVVVLFAGVDGAGKSETINLLNGWMDTRWLVNCAYGEASPDEKERPRFWRYWRDLPARGRIGLYNSAWYHRPLIDRVLHGDDDGALEKRLREVADFEQALVDDGVLVLKFWMHLSRKAQKRRLEQLEKDPVQSWRVTEEDWGRWRRYDDFVRAAETMILRTSTGRAPWYVIEGEDPRYREVVVGQRLRDALERHLTPAPPAPAPPVGELGDDGTASPTPTPTPTILSSLDLSLKLSPGAHKKKLSSEQARLGLLQRWAREAGVSSVVVFEGWDAAGKGGCIRRLTQALDFRDYNVWPVAAPTEEERARPYLWRFWRRLPRAGRVVVFDRSWYGRVLVERVEGFATRDEWMRAYHEINAFEKQLSDGGIVLSKLFLHVSPEEQLGRFEERGKVAHKAWKLTAEDWRNREKWDAYERAINAMVERTSTQLAPWTLVEANDKRFARVKVVKTIADALEEALDRRDLLRR